MLDGSEPNTCYKNKPSGNLYEKDNKYYKCDTGKTFDTSRTKCTQSGCENGYTRAGDICFHGKESYLSG